VKHFSARIVALCCVLASATVAAVEVWPSGRHLLTGDENRDGRADLWRRYDSRGQLTEIDRDTNFDGSPDVQEYYQRGVLIRRESDRNFNGQTDLVEEFDPDTHGQTRSVVDVDYDGTADLLVLFRDGRPVFSKQIYGVAERAETPKPRPGAHRHADGVHLAFLVDPSKADTAVRTTGFSTDDGEWVGLSTSGGLPSTRFTLIGRVPASARIVSPDGRAEALTIQLPHPSRAPPLS
jgi:hypothetical protein